MRIIISCTHFPVASGRYMTDAFRRLGADVRTLGDSTGNRIPWGTDGWLELDPKYTWHSDGDITKTWSDWTPDLIVHMDSSFAYHHPYYANVPHVVYGMDNHVRNYRDPKVDYERYFVAHKNVSEMSWYDDDGSPHHMGVYSADDMEHLPCGYDPVYFTPSPIPWGQREYDVALVGVMYSRRKELLEALHKAGLKVFAATGWVYDQYAAAYHNARISLCVSANGDLAQRVFETAAMGCAILTDPLADLMDRETNLTLGLQGYKVYEDAESCIESARELLNTEPVEQAQLVGDVDEVIMKIADGTGLGEFAAEQMQQSVLGKHTWDNRALRIVQWYKETYGKQKAEIQDTGNIEPDGALTWDVGGGSGDAVPTRNGGIEPVEEVAQTEEASSAHEEDLRHVTVEVNNERVEKTDNLDDKRGGGISALAELRPDTAPDDTQHEDVAGTEATDASVETVEAQTPKRKRRRGQ